MDALYKLEDLLLLKTSCSISTAKDRVSQLRDEGDMKDNVERHFCRKSTMHGNDV